MNTILLIFFTAFGLLALISCVLFWYESLNRPEARLPAPAPGLVACLRVWMGYCASYALCALLVPLGFFLKGGRGRENSSGPPLVLVHGLYHNATSWLYLGYFLRRRGYAPFAMTYATRGASPKSICDRLEAHVRRVEERCGRKPVLIGHSLGGLVIRAWLESEANRARVSGVITLGTPHGGSTLAHLAFGGLAANLRPGSAFLQRLESAPPLAPLPCVSLASPTDGAVLPAAALVPPKGWKFAATPESGHFAMLFRPSVARMLLAELRDMAQKR